MPKGHKWWACGKYLKYKILLCENQNKKNFLIKQNACNINIFQILKRF